MHKITVPVQNRKGRENPHIYDRLTGPTIALVVIDMQNVFMLPTMPLEVPLARAIIPNVNRLAEALRKAGGTVAWVQMTADDRFDAWSSWHERAPESRAEITELLRRGAEGHALHTDLQARPGDLKVEKTRYSAFIQDSSDLDRILRGRGVDTIIVTGTLTNVCCESTARDAMMLNYKTILVSDANATLSDEAHNAALANVLNYFGDVFSTDELVARLAAGPGIVKRAAAG